MNADELRYLQDYRTLAEGQQDHTGAPKEMTRQQETLKTKGLFFFMLFQMVGRSSEGYAARRNTIGRLGCVDDHLLCFFDARKRLH